MIRARWSLRVEFLYIPRALVVAAVLITTSGIDTIYHGDTVTGVIETVLGVALTAMTWHIARINTAAYRRLTRHHNNDHG